MNYARAKILDKIRTVPSMPVAAIKVIRLLADSEVDLTTVARIIEVDPGMTSNLLRLANSSYFGCPQSVGSVKEALVRLGMNNVLRLLLPLTVAPTIRHPVHGYDLQSGALLEHSVAVAVGSVELAQAMKILPPKDTFTAAILHDVGKILLGTFIQVEAEQIQRILSREGATFEEAEREVLGIDHAEAGAVLLESWNCPAPIVEVARWHHLPESIPGENLMVSLVHVADGLSMMQGIGAGLDGLNYRLSEPVLGKLHLSQEAVERVSCRMLEGLAELKVLFESVK